MQRNPNTLLYGVPAILTVVATVAALPNTADATRRRAVHQDYVVAKSEFGNGTVSGPVRRTSKGPQVRLPGGSWVWCEQSCSETLRLKTVDFWESGEGRGPHNSITNGGGIFGKLRLRFPY